MEEGIWVSPSSGTDFRYEIIPGFGQATHMAGCDGHFRQVGNYETRCGDFYMTLRCKCMEYSKTIEASRR